MDHKAPRRPHNVIDRPQLPDQDGMLLQHEISVRSLWNLAVCFTGLFVRLCLHYFCCRTGLYESHGQKYEMKEWVKWYVRILYLNIPSLYRVALRVALVLPYDLVRKKNMCSVVKRLPTCLFVPRVLQCV